MANYYVSNSGSSGSGTIGSPWGIPDLTTGSNPVIQGVALTTLVAGDTLYFRGGDYHLSGSTNPAHFDLQLLCPTHSGTLALPITLRSYPGETVNMHLDLGIQPLFGTINPVLSYVRFLGFTVYPTSHQSSGPPFFIEEVAKPFDLGGTGNEIGYCEIIGEYVASVDNHDGIRLDRNATNSWIHHNNIHDLLADPVNVNTCGIKSYAPVNSIIEDNYIHNCITGIMDKESGNPTSPIYRRNWVAGNTTYQFFGNSQTVSPNAIPAYQIYDNFFDGPGGVYLQILNTDDQIYNNIIRNLTPDAKDLTFGGKLCLISDSGQVYGVRSWNNIFMTAGVYPIWGYHTPSPYFPSGDSAPVLYSDYNVFDAAPNWAFDGGSTTYTLSQWRVAGWELHGIQDIDANIFVNLTDFVLKGIYPTAGRFGDMVGPRYSVAQIRNPARYGPSAMTVGGCLKVTCTAIQKWMARVTTTFATLQNKTSCSVQFWFAIDSIDAQATGLSVVTGSSNPVVCGGGGGGVGIRRFTFSMKNAAGSSVLTFTLDPLDIGNGHHVVFAYGSTLSTLYLDGIAVATQPSQGATLNSPTNFRLGWDDGSHAITIRLGEPAFWGAATLIPSEVIQLRDRVATPATLGRPATNYWTLQGPTGVTATIGSTGLNDSIGSANFDSLPFSTGTAVYDASQITIIPSVLFMTPYVDTTGYLLFIPIYLNSVFTNGGPIKPTSVTTDPVFTVAGSSASATMIPLDNTSCFIAYQFDVQITSGVTVTMSASFGWASTTSGAVSGTSVDGLGSDPSPCTNYSGYNTDFPMADSDRTLKLGYNPIPLGGGRGSIGQAMANWARRIYSNDPGTGVTNWTGVGTVTAFDDNNLPTTITGVVTATIDNSGNIDNGIDANGIPGTAGTWTLSYGDATPGVTSDPDTGHLLTIDLDIGASSWTITTVSSDPGTWSITDNCWHGITKTYSVAYKLTGGPLCPIIRISVSTTGAAGVMQIPILANGQSELGVFPPTYHGSNVSTPVTFAPMAVCPTFMNKVVGAYSLRWMPTQALMTITGDGNFVYASDLSQRTPTQFLMTNQDTTVLDITRIDPISDPSTFIIDYINGDATGTLTVPQTTWDSTFRSRFFYLITTSAPHGLRTGDKYVVTPLTNQARAAVIAWAGITLTSGVTTTGQTTFALNQTASLNGSAGSNLTVGTILQIGNATTDEQVTCTGPADASGNIVGLNVTVTRQSNGTTALTKPSGTVCYICSHIISSGILQAAYVISTTQIFQFQIKLSIPANIPNPTLLYFQAYSHGSCPTYSLLRPWSRPTMSYGHCAAVTSAVAAANDSGTCICWVSIPFMATDDAVTAAVNEMIPYLSLGVRVIVQCSNEVFNSGFDQNVLAVILSTVAPNPQTSGTGFAGGFNQYLASRQNHYSVLAKAAFTTAGLDPARVLWGHNGHRQTGLTSPDNDIALAYCQTWILPVELFWTESYADMTQGALLGSTYVSWLPSSTGVSGATASWPIATTRAMMMSYYRAAFRFGTTMGVSYLPTTLAISKYNNGISVNGVSPANMNPSTARMCTYEGSTTQPLPLPFAGGATPILPEVSAFTRDLEYDPAWYYTEIAYYQAIQESARTYALLMGDKFPDVDDSVPEFNSYFGCLLLVAPTDNTIGYMYPQYYWQGQQAGSGTGNLMGWAPTNPIIRDMSTDGVTIHVNESVRGQASIDWVGEPIPPPGKARSAAGMLMSC